MAHTDVRNSPSDGRVCSYVTLAPAERTPVNPSACLPIERCSDGDQRAEEALACERSPLSTQVGRQIHT
jgi:hypothetical protein